MSAFFSLASPFKGSRHFSSLGRVLERASSSPSSYSSSSFSSSPLSSSSSLWVRGLASAPKTPSPAGEKKEVMTPPSSSPKLAHKDDHHHHDNPVGLYHHPHHAHGDPRSHLFPDGTRDYRDTTEPFHWDDSWSNVPKQHFTTVDGQKMITGKPTRDLIDLFLVSQANTPFYPRMRMNIWSNYEFITRCEFLFFWIPTFIIWSLAIPTFSMLYLADEAMYTAMTVKVIGRQWYWIYEVESPVDDE